MKSTQSTIMGANLQTWPQQGGHDGARKTGTTVEESSIIQKTDHMLVRFNKSDGHRMRTHEAYK